MEHPNKLIDSFTGIIDISRFGREPIQPANVLLRGCVLRNTDWIVGLIINTGHDTKIMMSSTETKPKTSSLESRVSQQILRIITLLAIICIWGATGTIIWNHVRNRKDFYYLGDVEYSTGALWVVQFFYYFLLHASYIPVSLYVSMAVVRFYQGYFMKNDLEMYYPKTDTPALVRTMTLNEELGQISHIFSDKTGTLTCNIMDFRKMSIAGESYGLGITEIGKASWKLQGKEIPQAVLEAEEQSRLNAKPHVSFYDPKYKQHQSNGMIKPKLDEFFRFLSLCHDVLPERIDGRIKLSASNPDDEALVCASEYFGYQFIDRHGKNAIIFNKQSNQYEEIEILNIIEFSSKRKRMSVIARDRGSYNSMPGPGMNTENTVKSMDESVKANAKIKLYTKGADTVMFERFRAGQDDIINKTDQHVKDFSIEGLRCLLLGVTEIPIDNYNSWNAKYEAARSNIDQIERKKKGLDNAIESLEDEIERDLIVVGATAIEDRLQDGVPECIEELAAAGINIWILTGDKEETAINIAVACNLVRPKQYMDHIIINKSSAPNLDAMRAFIRAEIVRYDEEYATRGAMDVKPRALVIDGPSLITAMADRLKSNKALPKTTSSAALVPDASPPATPSASSKKSSAKDPQQADWMKDVDINNLPARELFVLLTKRCQAVIGCRVSPDQKREMVHLVKVNIPGVRTLSIGDGANDVAMIQEAHVGVGIRGEEGLQAVNSSDIAIAQFRYLSSILLKHGRYNYIRMCSVVCFMFYKNILMSTGQFWQNFYNAWSGQKYYTEGAIQMFNLLYTSIPILLLGVYDMDIRTSSVFRYPKIYLASVENFYFTVSPSIFNCG
jgi:phospholipid-transporting ATPase